MKKFSASNGSAHAITFAAPGSGLGMSLRAECACGWHGPWRRRARATESADVKTDRDARSHHLAHLEVKS